MAKSRKIGKLFAMKIADSFFLIGSMGAGKTTLGKLLAAELCFDFIDADHYLTDLLGVSIPTIFAVEGEAGFRQRESAVLDQLTQCGSIVLATGGGAVLNPENRRYLRERGTVIYLHIEPEIQYLRVKGDKNRPLLQAEDPEAHLRQMYIKRHPLYMETAHIRIDIRQQKARQVVQVLSALICSMRYNFSGCRLPDWVHILAEDR